MRQNNFFHLVFLLPFLVFVLFSECSQREESEPWVNLLIGETLDDWSIVGGEATYEVKDGVIIGTTVSNTPNTFLTPAEKHSDFILQIDFKVDSSMNSGIQIRSNSFPFYREGRFHGYQVEIDPSSRAWSGGIYDEARRGWLCPLDENPQAQKAFKQNEWNRYRIEAIGDTIKTWVNGVPASHLVDDMTSSGFIGLQVHSIREDKQPGTQIMWKNIKILTKDVRKYAQKTPLEPVVTKNSLTRDEVKKGWKLLWNGENTEGWKGAKMDTFPTVGWEIENGELRVTSIGGGESSAGGDIVTKELFGDFEFKVDFKLTEGANSGIKYYVDTELNKGSGSSIGLEYQILDDQKHPDAKKGNHEGSRTVASLYDLIEANPAKPINPIGEWNSAYIISKGGHVEHWLNGMMVLEYERKSDEYRKLVSESKYVKWPGFGELDKGQILLQDHGFEVAFRNIKIKSL